MNVLSHFFQIITILLICSNYLVAQVINVSHESGFYAEAITLSLQANTNFDIRYTLNGSDPTSTSPIYQQPIVIADRSDAPNMISLIATNPPSTVPTQLWSPPTAPILKSTILKIALFDQDQQIAELTQKEYFIGDAFMDIQLPIISLVTDSAGLFDFEDGMYVPGKDFAQNPNQWQPGNYFLKGNDWERIANMTFYEEKELVRQQDLEIQIHGGGSRILPCKSLRLSAKKSLNAEFISHPFFENKNKANFKKLILRNGGQDFTKKLFADVLMQSLIRHENIEYQEARPMVLFLNGSYWGIHNLREHYNSSYFEDYHDLDKEEIDYFEIAMSYLTNEGSSADYENMIEQLPALDLTKQEDYALVANQIDIDNYINHQITKVYFGGRDWAGNNERLWRPQKSGSKWRWIANDYDEAFVKTEFDSYGQATNEEGSNWPNPEWSTRLFRALMTNREFGIRYKNRLHEMLATTFEPTRVESHIDSIAAIYRNEMPRQIERWNYPAELSSWEEKIEEAKVFARERPDFLRQNFDEYFPNIYDNPTQVVFYPNPCANLLTIEKPFDGMAMEVRIFDIQGKRMGSTKLIQEAKNSFDVIDLPSGIYFLEVYNADLQTIAWHHLIKI